MNEMLKEISFQLGCVEREMIDKDDFINAMQEIYAFYNK
jgi:hypothetical protein